MKKKVSDLAITGAEPAFTNLLNVGQLNFPAWEDFHESFKQIFARRYYTNHGPLAEELESQLCEYLNVKHAVTVTNGTIGLLIAAKALELSGKVILPAFTFVASAQALTWSGLEPVFCDVDAKTHNISPEYVAPLLDDDEVSAILGVHLWGNPCQVDDLAALADDANVELYFDSAHAFGSEFGGRRIGAFGSAEVFSFHATKILGSAEGGVVCTNDDDLSCRLRNIRSSYGVRTPTQVPLTGNGRFSEAQAALALMNLKAIDSIIERCDLFHQHYSECLSLVPGLSLVETAANTRSNNQYTVLEIDANQLELTRDQLYSVLRAENIVCRRYFRPGIHRTEYYSQLVPQYLNALPVTDLLCDTVLQLPCGQEMDIDKIEVISSIIRIAQENAAAIRNALNQ